MIWELHDLQADPQDTNDISDESPDLFTAMQARYQELPIGPDISIYHDIPYEEKMHIAL